MLSRMAACRHTSPYREGKGFTLIELIVCVAILSVLLGLGMPAYKDWAARTKVRVAGESLLTGLVLARNQALQRNAQVHFYLTSDLTASCSLSGSGSSWVVSMDSPASGCNAAPSDTAAPRIIQTRSGNEGASRVTVSALTPTNGAANRLIFTGLGRVFSTDSAGNSTNPITTINLSFPDAGTCQSAGGNVRCLRVQITTGGEARLCDPAVSNANDPRIC